MWSLAAALQVNRENSARSGHLAHQRHLREILRAFDSQSPLIEQSPNFELQVGQSVRTKEGWLISQWQLNQLKPELAVWTSK